MSMIKVCLIGLGRTGKEIAKTILDDKNLELVSVICSSKSDKKGKDLGEILGCEKTDIMVESIDDLESVIIKTRPDVAIDFTNHASTVINAKMLSKMKVNLVIGTTGFTKLELRKLYVLSKKYDSGILYAPNITLGVNVLMLITNLAANILNNYDFQITETHHKNKKDAPSGTAIKIAKEIEKGLTSSGLRTDSTEIPINAIRAGGVIGKHEVMIIGEEDKIEISHESFSRKAFAAGAIRGTQFIYGKKGYFEMNDVLDLQKVLMDYLENEKDLFTKRHVYSTPYIVDSKEAF